MSQSLFYIPGELEETNRTDQMKFIMQCLCGPPTSYSTRNRASIFVDETMRQK